MYLLRESPKRAREPRVQLLGSGTILTEVLAAADLLHDDWGVEADVWSVTSFTELRREGIEVERWNLLDPTEEPRIPLRDRVPSPAWGSSRRSDRLRPRVPPTRSANGWRGPDRVLGTAGFGRSDTRLALRRFFEVDRHYLTLAALRELDPARAQEAIERYEIDPNAPMPTTV